MKRAKATPEEWKARVIEWQQSGMDRKEWCEQNDVGYKRFLHWERQCRQPKDQDSEERLQRQAPQFVQLRMEQSEERQERMQIRVEKESVFIEVSEGYNAELLVSVIKAVRQIC